ncbi:MAG: histidine kinase N-terminal 7TM domain-containing protein [Eubacterium sp.]
MSKKFLYNWAAIIALLTASRILYYCNTGFESYSNVVISLIYHIIPNMVLVFWCVSISRRILQKKVRQYVLSAGLLMIFWLSVRTVKWLFLTQLGSFARYMWYAYYIPMVLIPLIGVFIVDCIGKPENYNSPKRLKLLFIPALILVAFVFTNDFHRFVFDFPMGIEKCDSSYTYNFLFYIICAWFAALGLYFVAMLIKKCKAPGRKFYRQLPVLILMAAGVFWAMYALNIFSRVDIIQVNCLIVAALLESCIQSGLIRSNTGYAQLFENSTLNARIVDENYNICYSAKNATPLDKDVMRKAENSLVYVKASRLSSAAVTGGHILWNDDISQINRLNDELEEIHTRLSEKGDLLRAEINMREEKSMLDEKNRLYDRIAGDVAPQLALLESLIKQKYDTDEQQRSNISKMCVVAAYVKRRSNLVLLSEAQKQLPAKELELSLRESADNLCLCGFYCSLNSKCAGNVDFEILVTAYDFFENIVEQVIDQPEAMLINLDAKNESLRLRLQTHTSCSVRLPNIQKINELGGTVSMQNESSTLFICLEFLKGGQM